MDEVIKIGGHPVSTLDREGLCNRLLDDYQKRDNQLPRLVFSANAQGVSLYAHSFQYASYIDKADIVHPDGQSLVLFSKLFRKPPLPERVCTTDFFHDVAKTAQENGLRFYMLGGRPEINSRLPQKILKLYPKLIISGRHHGYFDEDELPAILQEIKDTKTDVLWVGMGRPLQEKFCIDMQNELKGVTWLKTCGGLYEYLTEQQPRAPLWMQKTSMEWFFRLMLEPKRLAGRYLTTNLHALYLMFRHLEIR